MLDGALTPAGEWGYRRYEAYCSSIPASPLDYRKWWNFDIVNYTTESERVVEKVTANFEKELREQL
jgi:hypothetical protein